MEPVFKSYPAFKAVGIAYRGGNQNGEIPEVWERFVPRMKEIENANEGAPSYGICRGFEGAKEDEFEYIAAMDVTSLDKIPDGMTGVEVPAYDNYAVFTHKGPISKIMDTVGYVFGKWMRESGYKHAPTPDFELYDDRFKGDDPDSEMDIYIPIVK